MEEWIKERYALSAERVREIIVEQAVEEPYRDFFVKTAKFLSQTMEVLEHFDSKASLEELQKQNQALYADILPENYGVSYGNPAYAADRLGEFGQVLTFLYAELRGTIVYAFEKRYWDFTVALELFLEIYSAFCDEELPEVRSLRDILKSYVQDYCQDMVEYRIRGAIDPELDFAVKIIREADLSDLRYLYSFGEYITDNEWKLAQYFSTLSEQEIEDMARTYTEGYRVGFEITRKDIRKKRTVQIRYNLGFERMIRAAILQFEEMGLKTTISRYATHAVNKRNQYKVGYMGGNANLQYDYDHKDDHALFLDREFVQKKLRSTREAYEKYRIQAGEHGGPAVIETFGEAAFSPVNKKEAWLLSEEQRKYQREIDNELGQIVNRYIKGDERSFTVIAYPLPEIGDNFEEIFSEIIRVNNLDSQKYTRIQQTIIDTLDTCNWVRITGKDDNETDLTIHLMEIQNPAEQTHFENCVADVNIPVGEVFTSPVLVGTNGLLHVKKVFIEGLLFRNLKLEFQNGKVVNYSCTNFSSEEENKKLIEDNILFHYQNLPMGEFAIGTNTTAYMVAKKFHIEDKMPILIAEKTGPHFAVGDTCYSWCEDIKVYNQNGKEIIARDNEVSILRREDLSKAYYDCHTDITIPYNELDKICVVDEAGNMTAIIADGRFVLPGTEELNEAFDE